MCLGSIVGQISTSAFYATGNTKTVIYMAAFNYTIYIPAKISAFLVWGSTGLAVSTSIYLLVNMFTLIYLFHRYYFQKDTNV
jgi:peptidoglycan biosynthesis protein MviN/MurJ (putative lipid II flippase)